MIDSRRLASAVSILVGERLSGIGHATGMGVFEFGGPASDVDPLPQGVAGGSKYAIHAQCAYRLVRHGSVVLGSRDQNWLVGGSAGDGRTMLDARAAAIDASLSEAPYIMVEAVAPSLVGDLTITMSNHMELGIFVDSSRPSEQWRFLRRFGEHITVPDGV